ncbi:MAG TPA: adenylyltransferase/cytidyltransferase family protein [Candidatus Krumholzibacteria bacterium]|nr:adenylyltransferase/cytidyltransferase family protein [Candidatus Krumholzibacteria bacterium]
MRPEGDGLARLVPPDELSSWAEAERAAGRSIVMTNGVYDLLHDGHVLSIVEAARWGDVLLVAINDDVSTRALKGPSRPILDQTVRATLVRGLRGVDAVTIFAASSVLPTILTVRPDVVAKGGQYSETEIVGHDEVTSWGGRVIRLPMVEGVSTTDLIERIRTRITAPKGKEDR